MDGFCVTRVSFSCLLLLQKPVDHLLQGKLWVGNEAFDCFHVVFKGKCRDVIQGPIALHFLRQLYIEVKPLCLEICATYKQELSTPGLVA